MDQRPLAADNPVEAATPRRRRWLHRLLVCLLGAVSLLIVFVLLGPTVLSSALGTRLVVSTINKAIPGTVRINDLSLGWFTRQAAHDFELSDAQGNPVLTVEQLEVSGVTLWHLLTGRRHIGMVRVINPVVRVHQYDDGTTSLGQAVGAQRPATGTGSAVDAGHMIADDLRVKLEVSGGHVVYDSARDPDWTIELTDLSATVAAMDAGRFAVELHTNVHQGNSHGSVQVKANGRDLMDASGNLDPARTRIDARIDVSDLPLSAVDRIAGQQGRLAALLGPALNAQIVVQGRLSQLSATLWANTQTLKALVGIESDGQAVRLNPETVIQLRVMPSAWDVMNRDVDPQVVTKLLEPFQIQLSPKDVYAEHTPLGLLDARGLKGTARLTVGDVVLDSTDARIGRVALRSSQARLEFDGPGGTADLSLKAMAEQGGQPGQIDLTLKLVNPIDHEGRFGGAGLGASLSGGATHLPVEALDRLLRGEGLFAATLGPLLDADIDAKLMPMPDRQARHGSLRVNARSRYLEASVRGQITGTDLVVEPESSLSVTATAPLCPLLWERLFPSRSDLHGVALAQPAVLKIVVEHLRLPLDTGRAHEARVNLRASIDQVVPTGDHRMAGLALRRVSLQLSDQQDAAGPDALRCVFGGLLTHEQKTATIRANLNVFDAWSEHRTLNGRCLIEALPVRAIGVATGAQARLTDWLGQRIDKVAVEVVSDQERSVTVTGRVVSDRLTALVGGRYTGADQRIALRPGSWVEYEMKPELLADWLVPDNGAGREAPPRVVLGGPVKVKAIAQEAQWLLGGGAASSGAGRTSSASSLDGLKLTAGLKSNGTTVRWGRPHDWVVIKAVNGSLNTSDLREGVEVALRFDIHESDQQPNDTPSGSLVSRGRVAGWVSQAGEMDLGGATIQFQSKAQGLPLGLMDALTGTAIADLVGDVASVKLRGQIAPGEAGKLDLIVQTPQGNARVATTMSDPIRLRSDAVATLSVTPRLSGRWLKRINPLLIDSVASQQPIRLEVKQKGFLLPVADFDLRGVKANAQLDLGVLQFRSNGLVDLIRRGFRRDTSRPAVARFAPMSLRLDDGVISYRDLTMEIDNLLLGFRGTTDQVEDRVDQIMSISRHTMAKVFGLGDVLEEGYEFNVPIRGTIDNPNFDSAALLGEATRLAARSRLKKHVGGPEGEAAGQILDLILGGEKERQR